MFSISYDLVVSRLAEPTWFLTTNFQRKKIMATNPPKGDGHRNGAVKQRSQTQTPAGNWVKRNTNNGRFMDVKSDQLPFKGVRKEK
jgi:hypothetical protein